MTEERLQEPVSVSNAGSMERSAFRAPPLVSMIDPHGKMHEIDTMPCHIQQLSYIYQINVRNNLDMVNKLNNQVPSRLSDTITLNSLGQDRQYFSNSYTRL